MASGRPTTADESSTTIRCWQASAISKPPPSAAPLIAATTGRGYVSSLRRSALIASMPANTDAASAGPACIISVRLPPAKKVFFALATTTPMTSSTSSYSRATAACIERW